MLVADAITLTLPPAVSANRYWATRVVVPKGGKPMAMTYVTAEAKQYRESVAWLLRSAGVRKPLSGRVLVDIQMYPHRPLDYKKRMRTMGEDWDTTVQRIDADNCIKVVCDSLKDIAFGDDKLIAKVTCEVMEPDGRDACVVVTIAPYSRTAAQQVNLLPKAILPPPAAPEPVLLDGRPITPEALELPF